MITQPVLAEASKIASTAKPIHEIHNDRWLFSFESVPNLYVVAPIGTSELGIAILVVEQIAIVRAQQASDFAARAIEHLSLMDFQPDSGKMQ